MGLFGVISEIPLVFFDPSFHASDLDGSGGLSVTEMEQMVDADAQRVLENLPDAEVWLSSITPNKAARILSYWSPSESARIFDGIAAVRPFEALSILLQGRESLGEPESCRGQQAANWLSGMSYRNRDYLLGLLRYVDAPWAAAVSHYLSGAASFVCEEARNEMLEASEVLLGSVVRAAGGGRGRVASLHRSSVVVVPMRAYAIASSNTYAALMTEDVSTCTVLTLFDPSSRSGVVAHLDIGCDWQNSLDRIFAELRGRGLSPSRMTARIVGGAAGIAGSRRLFEDLQERLGLEGVSVAEASLGEGRSYSSYVLDLTSGRLDFYRGPYLIQDPVVDDPVHPYLLRRAVLATPE